jgi:hypothetical protein
MAISCPPEGKILIDDIINEVNLNSGHRIDENNPHNTTPGKIGAVNVTGDTMTGPLGVDVITTEDGSVSHNVNTMGIESGSNENGNWTKLPDGTMICYGEVAITPTPDEPTRGTVVFPQPFTVTPSITCTMRSSVPGETAVEVTFISSSMNGFDAVVYRTNDTTTAVIWQAIGRWK